MIIISFIGFFISLFIIFSLSKKNLQHFIEKKNNFYTPKIDEVKLLITGNHNKLLTQEKLLQLTNKKEQEQKDYIIKIEEQHQKKITLLKKDLEVIYNKKLSIEEQKIKAILLEDMMNYHIKKFLESYEYLTDLALDVSINDFLKKL